MNGLTFSLRKPRQIDVKWFGQVWQKTPKKHKTQNSQTSVLDMAVNFHGSSKIPNMLFQNQ